MPKNKEELFGADYLKQCCKLLSAYNVNQVVFEYDGSGDYGDINDASIWLAPDADAVGKVMEKTSGPPPAEVVASVTRLKRVPWNHFVDERRKEKNPILTAAACDKMQDEAFELLPSGWEINDGSYGTVIISVAAEEISIEQKERYTEIRTENFKW